MGCKRRAAIVAACLLLAALSGEADARKLQMSGTWALRTGQIFVPLQFAAPTSMLGHTSIGDLSKAFGVPNGPIPGRGGVTATGSGPATLRIPPHRFALAAPALGFNAIPLAGQTLVQITTRLAADGPIAPATLAAGAGPGSFTWCPSDPGCSDPPGADPPPGDPGSNGRIVYNAGANQFGGTLQLGLSGSGLLSLLYQAIPFRVAHHSLALGSIPEAIALGGSYAATRMVLPVPAAVTEVAGYHSAGGLILYPGARVTSMGGLTTTCGPGCGPPLVPPAISSTHHGFPATTGTVLAQQITGTAGDDFFTVMGSDMRTALGVGNISLVAGGLARRNTSYSATSYAQFQKIRMTLAAPLPSLSPAGLAAAGTLVLLAAGFALRRHSAGNR